MTTMKTRNVHKTVCPLKLCTDISDVLYNWIRQ